MELIEVLKKRKTVRDFKPDDIPDEDLDKILAAGSMAPIGLGEHSNLRFTVVRNEEFFNEIKQETIKIKGEGSEKVFYNAPVVVVISAKKPVIHGISDQNAAVAAENMLLMATDLGIGSAFILDASVVIRQSCTLAKMLELPKDFDPYVCVCLGYSADEPCCDRKFQVDVVTNWV